MGDIEQPSTYANSAGPGEPVLLRVVSRVADVAAADWDACAGQDNPFTSHRFLKALEDSGSATAETGWLRQHLLLEDSNGALLGCMPCYLKSHSQGEYVFDHGWADAYQRAGGRYYPKLQASVPFTPVTGKRLLVRPGEGERDRQAILLQAAMQVTERLGVSSLHITFLTREEWQLAGDMGLLKRTDHQFHWRNEGYASFEDFLDALASRKRKAIRKERREALSGGIEIEWLTGRDITEAHWDAFFAFYMDTGSRKWGRPYLNRKAFSLIGAATGESCLLVMAMRGQRAIAGSLHMIGGDCLYGRYWGAVEHHPCLHFELCYYQAIEFAIAHGIARVEAGAQGEHKLARGYLPAKTYSVHYIADPALRRAIADYLERERAYVDAAGEELAEYAPFRKVAPDQA
jgi:predicted N-acyltransferase